MSLTIHTVQGNFRSNAVEIAAEIGNVDLKSHYIQWSELKSKENQAVNPKGQVPTLVTPEGNVPQTCAILTYVAKAAKSGNLYGSTEFETAQVDQWLNFTQSEILGAVAPILLQVWGFRQSNAEQLKASTEATEKLLGYLNNSIFNSQQFLVKSGLTVADIFLHSVLVYAFRCAFTAEQRAKFSNVTAWFERVSQNPAVVKFYGVNRYSSVSWL